MKCQFVSIYNNVLPLIGFGGFTCQARGAFGIHWEKEKEEEVGTYTIHTHIN